MLKQDPLFLLKLFKIEHADTGGDWIKVKCPFHKETDNHITVAKGGINRSSGVFKCFVCDSPHSLVDYLALTQNMPVAVIEAHADNVLGSQGTNIDPGLIEMCHQELMCNSEYLSKLLNKHGINSESVVTYRLGYYAHSKRIIIPVYNRDGKLVNTRQYKYDLAIGEEKIISPKKTVTGLYLVDKLDNANEVVITEGEFKAILLNQNGFPSVASTAGATGFQLTWCSLFKDKDVVIIFDVDKAGRINAEKLSLMMLRFARSVKNIFLTEVTDIANGDITDYFVKKLRTAGDLRAKIDAWPKMERHVIDNKESMNTPINLSLSKCADARMHGKIISTTAVVSAKDMAPYVVPSAGKILCTRDKKCCVMCPVYETDGAYKVEISPDSSVLLDLVASGEDNQIKKIKDFIGIPAACKTSHFERTDSLNIEEIRLVPQIKIGSTTEEQVTRKAWFVGSGLACNNAFKFTGRACSEPSDSHSTALFYDAEPVEEDIHNYSATVDLSHFRPAEWTRGSVERKLKEIYDDLSDNVTRIYLRPDLHFFYDLVWHSALHFNFQGKLVKGWCDALVIGDSGQGKSECAKLLMEHYRCGERVDSKRASVAGIMGGLQQTANRWFITWGTIPLNDGRLVILEEVKGMGQAELATMTDMRSSGIAEIIKIERSRTHARTRLIWITNPRSDMKLGAYNHGVLAVRELMGALEDVRRFDMVMAVCSGDVSIDIINARRDSKTAHTYTSDLCSANVTYAWSRKADDIVITSEAETSILQAATRMGNTYSSDIPIVEPSDQRLKIARLAVACALRTNSVENGKVMVYPCHVEVIEAFLNKIYSDKGLGYADFSAKANGEKKIHDPKEIKEYISKGPAPKMLVEFLLDGDAIGPADIINAVECDIDKAHSIIGALARMNCLKRGQRGLYRKTSAFIEVLKEMDRAGGLSTVSHREKLAQGEI